MIHDRRTLVCVMTVGGKRQQKEINHQIFMHSGAVVTCRGWQAWLAKSKWFMPLKGNKTLSHHIWASFYFYTSIKRWCNLLITVFDFPLLMFNPVHLDRMTLFKMQIIDCLILMIWACQAALWLTVEPQNTDEYVSGCREQAQSCVFVLDPDERVSHLYRFLFFKKWWRCFPVFNINPDSGCETPDEYFTISLLTEIKIQDKVVYERHTNISQCVSSVNLHPNVLKCPSPLSGIAQSLIIHCKALKHPGLLNFLFLFSFKQWIL